MSRFVCWTSVSSASKLLLKRKKAKKERGEVAKEDEKSLALSTRASCSYNLNEHSYNL
jgi:hypothetical protein